jgi:hypothetical protein
MLICPFFIGSNFVSLPFVTKVKNQDPEDLPLSYPLRGLLGSFLDEGVCWSNREVERSDFRFETSDFRCNQLDTSRPSNLQSTI